MSDASRLLAAWGDACATGTKAEQAAARAAFYEAKYRDVPVEELAVGMTIDDEDRNVFLADIGHVAVGPNWVTARAWHPKARVYPNPPRRFRRGTTVRIDREHSKNDAANRG